MPNPPTDATLAHVLQLPIVSDFLARVENSKIAPLFAEYRDAFLTCSAATTRHHNFTHGLLIHTAEVWECAKAFRYAAPDRLRYDGDTSRPYAPAGDDVYVLRLSGNDAITSTNIVGPSTESSFTLDELFVAVFVHDFAKIKQYEPADNHAWRKVEMICNQETWTLRELAKHGIALTDNELVGLLHAEGGYTEFAVDWRPMSVILHAADLWSSQAMAAVWNPAEAMGVTCPACNSPMRAISGKNGAFYGCTRYAAGCRGTRDVSSLPPVGEAFLKWLQSMYPLPTPA